MTSLLSRTCCLVFLFLVRGIKHRYHPFTHKITASSYVVRRATVTSMTTGHVPSSDPVITALTDLNEAQHAAVTANLAHIRVQAGPGSGKTRVLVNRVAYMIREQNVLPRDILAVTFTNKAANEMKERLGKLLSTSSTTLSTDNKTNNNYELVHCTTLHSFCANVLRKYGPKSDRSFTIYDDTDSKKLVRNILTEMKEDLDVSSPVRVREAISMLKRECLLDRSSSFDDYDDESWLIESNKSSGSRSRRLRFNDPFYNVVQQVYQRYREALRMNNAKDFDDLVGDTLALLRASDRARESARDRAKASTTGSRRNSLSSSKSKSISNSVKDGSSNDNDDASTKSGTEQEEDREDNERRKGIAPDDADAIQGALRLYPVFLLYLIPRTRSLTPSYTRWKMSSLVIYPLHINTPCDSLFRCDADANPMSGAEWLRKRYKHVLCDEWQDVDKCQYELLKALVMPSQATGMKQDTNGISSGGVSDDGSASRGGVGDDGSASRGGVVNSDSDSASIASMDIKTSVNIVHAPPPPAPPLALARTLFVVGDTAQVTGLSHTILISSLHIRIISCCIPTQFGY